MIMRDYNLLQTQNRLRRDQSGEFGIKILHYIVHGYVISIIIDLKTAYIEKKHPNAYNPLTIIM